jgi:hypothetical protein
MNANSWVARRRPVRSLQPVTNRGSGGPCFDRFAAAMQAEPPPAAQVIPDTPGDPQVEPAAVRATPIRVAPPPPAQRPAAQRPAAQHPAAQHPAAQRPDDPPFIGPSRGAMAGATPMPRRPVQDRFDGADPARARDIPWLGIGSWVLFCAALFVSLLGWPDQTALDRVTGLTLDRVTEIWSGHGPAGGADRSGGIATTQEPMPTEDLSIPAREQDWSSMTPPAAQQPSVAPDPGPAANGAATRMPGGPPLPQFKPSLDRVAAKFSSAFFEIGDRLQQQGDFDAALHMRRQGSNLNPWRGPVASDL